MTWTYGGNLAGPRDRVRFLIGDTDPDDPQLQDGEIDGLLGDVENLPQWAAPLAADALAAKYARQVSYSAGRQSRQLGDRASHYRELAAELRRAAARYVVPVSTGQEVSADREDSQDAALKQPNFVIGQMDNRDAIRPRPLPRGEDEDLIP
jgi:hypothetical protein